MNFAFALALTMYGIPADCRLQWNMQSIYELLNKIQINVKRVRRYWNYNEGGGQ